MSLEKPAAAAASGTLLEQWAGRWPQALEQWSRFTKLSEPHWCATGKEARREGLSESFAMIRLTDQAVVIDLESIRERHLEGFAVEILAHEIGHHVYCPANLGDHGRMIARIRAGLPTKESLAPLVANLYADLLVNDRLQRGCRLDIAGVYRALGKGASSKLWDFTMRIYEILWSLQKGDLVAGKVDSVMEGDAQLGARLIRNYARDWLEGAGRFAVLCLRYLLADAGTPMEKLLRGWSDTAHSGAGAGDAPAGLTEIEEGEATGAVHPADDPELAGLEPESDKKPEEGDGGPPTDATSPGGSRGQYREPFQYGEILRSLGLKLTDHEIAVRYYRERALPHLVSFPVITMPESTEPLQEGLEPWEFGQPLEDADWFQSILTSPHVVPGVTTVQRTWGTMAGAQPEKFPIDLDLYVDCSGSMPNPQSSVSYLTLAGAIIALSALRTGSRVQATLWSGPRQFETTGGFTTDEQRVLRILTGYLGGSTAFPIHLLRGTYANRKPSDRKVHILSISDEGVDTMFEKDERGSSGWDIARTALEKAKAGGSLVLNLYQEWQKTPCLVRAAGMGWQVHRVTDWEELVAFAREFSRATYGGAP